MLCFDDGGVQIFSIGVFDSTEISLWTVNEGIDILEATTPTKVIT